MISSAPHALAPASSYSTSRHTFTSDQTVQQLPLTPLSPSYPKSGPAAPYPAPASAPRSAPAHMNAFPAPGVRASSQNGHSEVKEENERLKARLAANDQRYQALALRMHLMERRQDLTASSGEPTNFNGPQSSGDLANVPMPFSHPLLPASTQGGDAREGTGPIPNINGIHTAPIPQQMRMEGSGQQPHGYDMSGESFSDAPYREFSSRLVFNFPFHL